MPHRKLVEVNCDMGEGFGRWKLGPDEELMAVVDVANIACGFHAGDPSIMLKTIRMAKKEKKTVGAHPGLPDLCGFGRRRMDVAPEDMYASVLYQVGALSAMLAAEEMELTFVKPHGELYFYVQRDDAIREAVIRAVADFKVPIYSLPTDAMAETCRRFGVSLVPEFFPDIDYDAQGQLVPVGRSMPVNPDKIKRRVLSFVQRGEVTSSAGTTIALGFGGQQGSRFTICIHSDLPGALENALAARDGIKEALAKGECKGSLTCS